MEGRAQGQTDTPLNARGIEQAKRLAARLVGEAEAFGALYTSSLQRARLTADIIGAAVGLNPVADNRLVEVNVGAIEGMTLDEVKSKYPELDAAWRTGVERIQWPGAEERADLANRLRAFHDEIYARHNGEKIIVVSHGAAIGLYLMLLLGLDMNRRSPFDLDNASLTIAHLHKPINRLRVLNDTYHLK